MNHTGLPSDRSEEGLSGWRQAMRVLAKEPNVACKISGLGQPGRLWTVEGNRPIVLNTIAIFGIDRLIADFATVCDGFRAIGAGFGTAEQAALFHDNAVRFYRLD